MTNSLVFLAGKRTPFGAYGGSLKAVQPSDMSVCAAAAALQQAGVRPDQIDHTVFGNVLMSASEGIYTPRHLGLKLGIPQDRPALGINRLCGTGFQVVIEAYQQMLSGDTQVALVGGVENMSLSPYLLRDARWGMRMGHAPAVDMMTEALHDRYVDLPMGMTAEKLGEQYGIRREDSDAFALQSQQRFQAAFEAGKFAEEVVPVTGGGLKQEVLKDEHPRFGSTPEGLTKLKPVFKKDGQVTAGNASGIVDGAAAMVVSTESWAKANGAKPLARLVSYGIVGCDPSIMGIGPAPAARVALKRAGMSLGQLDLIEVNEAFAPQALAVQKELQIPNEIFNVNGGAIAVGHPLAASGTRILTTLIYELKRRGKRWGMGSACIGGGQGIALIVEAL